MRLAPCPGNSQPSPETQRNHIDSGLVVCHAAPENAPKRKRVAQHIILLCCHVTSIFGKLLICELACPSVLEASLDSCPFTTALGRASSNSPRSLAKAFSFLCTCRQWEQNRCFEKSKDQSPEALRPRLSFLVGKEAPEMSDERPFWDQPSWTKSYLGVDAMEERERSQKKSGMLHCYSVALCILFPI